MERMAYPTMTSALAYGYLSGYSTVINAITNGGAYAVVDAHNYGRYNNQIITDTTGFGTFWANVASAFKNNPKVVSPISNDTMEES